MKRYLYFFMMLFLLVTAVLGFQLKNSTAQEAASFKDVVPFFTQGGNIGFFDQKKGTLYFYDDQMSKCLFQYQLKELGEPAVNVAKQDTAPTATEPAENYMNF